MTICKNCVLDDRTAAITFDPAGVCSFCHFLDARTTEVPTDPERREAQKQAIISRMKRSGRNSKYDCVIGLSGGIDSSYAALLAVREGLRPLAVHVDNGWNTEIAVSNIEKLVRQLKLDLVTRVIDWEEFRGIQLSVLRAGVVDLELVSDHAIIAGMYSAARRFSIKFIVSGDNEATESSLPQGWNYNRKSDLRHIRAINDAYEKASMKTYPHLSTVSIMLARRVLGIESFSILSWSDYNKERAFRELEDAVGYRRYGGKHFESVITRFYQGYILPKKFGIDKRRYHYSLLIRSGQMTRAEALDDLERPPYDPHLMQMDKSYVCKKFGINESEFDRIMAESPRPHSAFASDERVVRLLLDSFHRARGIVARARSFRRQH